MSVCRDCGMSGMEPDGCGLMYCPARTPRPSPEEKPRVNTSHAEFTFDTRDPDKIRQIVDNLNKSGIAHLPPETELSMPDPIMKYFAYDHLPEHLQAVSKPFCDVATWMSESLPDGPEKSAGLRKLLEAKDCAVRAALG